MIKKRKIGKIQLIIGIVMLVIGIGGMIISLVWFNEVYNKYVEIQSDDREQLRQDCPECSETEINILWYEAYNSKFNILSNIMPLISSLGVVSILFILLSLLFVSQGLVNMSESTNEI